MPESPDISPATSKHYGLEVAHPHPWKLTLAQARRLQEELRACVYAAPLLEANVHTVGGVDASYSRGRVYAAAVMLAFPDLTLVAQSWAMLPTAFPYVPGLLSFREAPAALAALARLSSLPDVLIVDGHGRAHPRRFGLACHLGVLLDLPVIGCAKSILVGDALPLGETRGCTARILDNGEVIGRVLRTRTGVKPVYISVGHRVDLESAVRLVLRCTTYYRLPEPLRRADQLAAQAKKTGLTERTLE